MPPQKHLEAGRRCCQGCPEQHSGDTPPFLCAHGEEGWPPHHAKEAEKTRKQDELVCD